MKVTVVTPTWGRHDVLLNRCIPSVQAQTYLDFEHVIVSDGPDPELRALIPDDPRIRFVELGEHDPNARWGHWARLHGIDIAKGDLIAYLDDDNAYAPHHLEVVVAALTAAEADFAYSQMIVRGRGPDYVVGGQPPAYEQVDTSLLVHRRELLDRATWTQSLPTIDWDLVERWMQAGSRWTFVPQITVDYYW